MPRGFTELEKTNIRLRLLESGKEAFGRYGIKKTSVEDLARMAGISKGAFYQFFPSKEDLYFKIIRHYEADMHKNMLDLINSPSGDERDLLKSVMKAVMNLVESDPFYQRLLGKEEFEYLWQKFTPEQLEDAMDADVDFSSQLVNVWKEKGKLKVDDPKLITGVFRSIFFLFLHKQDIGEDIFSQVVDLLLDSSIEKLIER